MMRSRLLVFFSFSVLICSLLLGSQVWAQPTCGSEIWGEGEDSLEGFYCLGKPDKGDSDSLIVYFHGLGGSELEWFTNPQLLALQDKMKAQGLDPWVITISYGPGWLLTEVPNSWLLFQKTMDEVLPKLEQLIRPNGFKSKYLVGASMGGFNAAQVLLKRSSLFEKYMLICPAITSVGPYNTEQEVADFIKRTGADPVRVSFLLSWAKEEFPSEQDWEHHAPLILASRPLALPSVYISCGNKDEYGFFEASKGLFDLIRPQSLRSWWTPIADGAHCAYDLEDILSFLKSK